MSLKIIIGKASSGKTDMLLKDLTARADRKKNELFYILSPEQASFIMQSEVVKHHPRSATMNIDVVSFNRLAHVVFTEVGVNISDILDDTGKTLILRKVVDDLKNDLTVYKNKIRMPGFIEEIKSVVTELKQYDIDDNGLFLMREAAEEKGNRLLSAKLDDIRLIYEKFNREIEDKYTTSEEVLDVFARIIPKSERLKGAHIYLDGYTGFTPIQLKILESMLRHCADVNLTLTLPEEKIDINCPEYEMFHLSNETYFKLMEIAERAGTEVETVSTKTEAGVSKNAYVPDMENAASENSETGVSQNANKIVVENDAQGNADTGAFPKANITGTKNDIQRSSEAGIHKKAYVYGALNPIDEVVFTAKEVLRLVRHEGYRYKDIAVIASDMETYYSIIRDIFEEAKISAFIDYKALLSENPGSRFVKAALNLLESPYAVEPLCAYLKTGLTGITYEETGKIENYCLEFGIKGFAGFEREFKKNRKVRDDVFWDLEDINRIREKVNKSFGRFYAKGIGERKTAEYYSKNLIKLLEENHIEKQLEKMADAFKNQGELKLYKEYSQIYELILGLIEKVSKLLGGEKVTTKEYLDIISDGLMEIKVGIVPPSLDDLIVGDLTRTRFSGAKAIFMIGVNDGKVPKVSKNTGLFTQKERELLKNENFSLAPGVLENLYTQRFYLHMLFSKPEEKLYLTYAKGSETGEPLEPSMVLDSFNDYIEGVNLRIIEKAPFETWKQQSLRDAAETVRRFVAKEVFRNENTEIDESVLRYFAEREPEILSPIIEGGFYNNRETLISKELAEKLYGQVLSGSVSRFEKYSECAFKHFLNYGLRLEKRPEYKIEATDIGTLYHDSLEKYSKKLSENKLTFRDVTDEESHRIAVESVKESLENMDSDVIMESARNRFLLKRITDVTLKTTDVLRDHVKAGAFEPSEFEYEFKSTVNDHIEFKGKIDRVDIYDADDYFVKIIDYKSGDKKFDLKDIFLGTQLQLVAYLSEEVKASKTQHPDKNVKPGGVYYYLINDRFLKDESEISTKHRMSGLTSSDKNAIEAVDISLSEGSTKSNIVDVSYTSNGFSSYAKVADDNQFENLMAYVDEKIKSIGEEIYDGHIDTNPLYENSTSNACRFCDFRDICKFEDGNFGNAFRTAPDLSSDEIKAIVLDGADDAALNSEEIKAIVLDGANDTAPKSEEIKAIVLDGAHDATPNEDN